MRNPGGYFFGADGAFAAAQEGVRAILSRQLRRRFGKLPAWALERLDQAPPDQLEDAALRAHPDKARLDAVVTRWFKRRLHRLAVPVADDTLNSLVEDHTMLAENLENWVRRERREGRREGRQEAAARILRKLLQLKFGPLPDWAEARLTAAPADQLEAWAEALLLADDLDALLGAP